LRLQADSFYRNDGALFRDRTAASGLGVVSRQFTRFGLGWVDFDNDGLLDLYEANGRVMRQSHTFGDDPYSEPNLLFRGEAQDGQPEGRFREVNPRGGMTDQLPLNSRSAAFGDVDNDGGMDVLVVNIDGPVQLFRNVLAGRGSWVSFDLRDDGQSALHARVAIRQETGQVFRFARAASSYQASNDPRVHFGLGAAESASEVTVTWPDGSAEVFGERAANQIHLLRRGAGESE
jgi:enediyne biosynthesis protein E4